MSFKARCETTAMGSMPHTDVDRALALALSLDIPFWPQLPKLGYSEDMFVQFSHDFPGVTVDGEQRKIRFSHERFYTEFTEYSEAIELPGSLALTEDVSVTYPRFLNQDLSAYDAIRGQVTGPINLGFQVMDEDGRPIIYDDQVRGILFDFVQRKANLQYRELGRRNDNAFVWLDDPGFWWVFSSVTGYNDTQAAADYVDFLEGLEGPKALHMCVNVNLPYLVDLGVDILSIDAYQFEAMPREYARSLSDFMAGGGIVCWGIVPTEAAPLESESPDRLVERLLRYWGVLSEVSDTSIEDIAWNSLLAPARCCLRSPGERGTMDGATCDGAGPDLEPTIEEGLVEKAFSYLAEVSGTLKAKLDI